MRLKLIALEIRSSLGKLWLGKIRNWYIEEISVFERIDLSRNILVCVYMCEFVKMKDKLDKNK